MQIIRRRDPALEYTCDIFRYFAFPAFKNRMVFAGYMPIEPHLRRKIKIRMIAVGAIRSHHL